MGGAVPGRDGAAEPDPAARDADQAGRSLLPSPLPLPVPALPSCCSRLPCCPLSLFKKRDPRCPDESCIDRLSVRSILAGSQEIVGSFSERGGAGQAGVPEAWTKSVSVKHLNRMSNTAGGGGGGGGGAADGKGSMMQALDDQAKRIKREDGTKKVIMSVARNVLLRCDLPFELRFGCAPLLLFSFFLLPLHPDSLLSLPSPRPDPPPPLSGAVPSTPTRRASTAFHRGAAVGATGRLSGTNMGDFEDLGFEIQMSIQAIGPLQSMRQL